MEWIGLGIVIAAIGAIVRFGWMTWKRQRRSVLNLADSHFPSPPKKSDTLVTTPALTPVPRVDAPKTLVEKVDKYAKLRHFLEQKKYEAADRETWRLMLQIVGARKRGYFELEDFEQFPSSDLQAIDRLWLDLSDGHFGFSVQKQIYQEVETEFSQLGIRVGWVNGGKWLKIDDPVDTVDCPKGHRPCAMWQSQLVSFGFLGLGMCFEVFLSRTDL